MFLIRMTHLKYDTHCAPLEREQSTYRYYRHTAPLEREQKTSYYRHTAPLELKTGNTFVQTYGAPLGL